MLCWLSLLPPSRQIPTYAGEGPHVGDLPQSNQNQVPVVQKGTPGHELSVSIFSNCVSQKQRHLQKEFNGIPREVLLAPF